MPLISDKSSNILLAYQNFQLKSILLATVVQICHARVGGKNVTKEVAEDLYSWLAPVMSVCQTQCVELRDLMNQLVAGTAPATKTPQTNMGILFGHHAREFFHGRMLPGCCHFGCSNLSGISEAGLHTQLCGGCRRARYCSVVCQKAAWLEGGHICVCGE